MRHLKVSLNFKKYESLIYKYPSQWCQTVGLKITLTTKSKYLKLVCFIYQNRSVNTSQVVNEYCYLKIQGAQYIYLFD